MYCTHHKKCKCCGNICDSFIYFSKLQQFSVSHKKLVENVISLVFYFQKINGSHKSVVKCKLFLKSLAHFNVQKLKNGNLNIYKREKFLFYKM